MHQELNKYATMLYFALQSLQQKARGTKACCFCIPYAPGLPGLHHTNSSSTWLSWGIFWQRKPASCSSSFWLSSNSSEWSKPFRIWFVANSIVSPLPLCTPLKVCSRSTGSGRWNSSSESYLTLKHSSGNSSLSLQSRLQKRLGSSILSTPAPDLGLWLPDKWGMPSNIHPQSSAQCLAKGKGLNLNKWPYGWIFLY